MLGMAQPSKPLAIIKGASTGIGYQLAICCGQRGFDLVVVADEPGIQKAGKDFEALGVKVDALQADLAEVEGVDKLYVLIGARPVEALLRTWVGQRFLD
jgi:short-subunit dehydrogenase